MSTSALATDRESTGRVSGGLGRTPPAPPAAAPRNRATAKPLVSLLGAITVLAGGAALRQTVSGTSWIAPSVQVVALIWLIGVGCRLWGLPAPVTLLAQLAGAVITLTAVFTTGGYAGVLPNAQAVREAQALLSGAWTQIMQSTVPAPSTPQLGFLIAVALGLIALIVDFFVSEVEAPALVALPLLCLYSVPASIDEQLLPWWTFALPAASYAVLMAVAGHPGRRVGLRAGIGIATTGGLAVAVAIIGSLTLADSVTQVGTAGRLDRSGGEATGSDVGLSPFATLHGDLQRGDSRDVLQVSGLPGPDYLRTTALETWNAAQGFSLSDPTTGARAAGSPISVQPLAVNPSAQPALVSVTVLNFADRFVPIYQGTTGISGLGGDYAYNPGLGSVFRERSSTPANYQLAVSYGQISADVLRTDTVSPRAGLTSAEGVPVVAVQLAQALTAPGQTAFDKAVLLKDYFTTPSNGFQYSLSVPVGNSGDLLTDFLQNRQGYCEQYAAAMTIMLRSIGIPARVAIGFTQGLQVSPGTFTITSHDAHAWVEVLFDRAGWVRFDPTPLSEAVGGQQGFETPPASVGPTAESSAAASTEPPASQSDTSITSRATVTDFETVTMAGGAVSAAQSFWKPWYTWTLLVLATVTTLVAAPSTIRRRRSRKRLAVAASGGQGAAAAAWAEVEDLAVDHGLNANRGSTVRKAANHVARDGKLSEAARAGLRRIALGTEASWYSPDGYHSADSSNLAEDVRRIGVDLEHSSPRSLLRRLLPASVLGRD